MPINTAASLQQTVLRNLSNVELGARGALRLSQTFLKASPVALKWGLSRQQPSPKALRELCESLGTTYIKFGQLIASSPSVFPKEYVEEFQKLLDQTSYIPFRKIKQIIESDLDAPLQTLFKDFDPEPLASASIAQVHTATLHTGEEVVVKVQKPGVDTIISVDMNTAYVCARIVELMMPKVGKEAIAGMIAELYQAMIDECDFVKEADNLDEFRQYLAATGNTDVIAPKPYRNVSSKKVLTMERLYGNSLSNLDEIKKASDDPEKVLMSAMNTWFGSLTQCDSFHADLHNGNMMVLNDGRVAFIDFGMVGRIEPDAWQALFGLMGGLSSQDYKLVAESMLAVGLTKEKVNVDELTEDLTQLFASLYSLDPYSQFEASSDSLGGVEDAITNLGEVAKQYGIRFPRAFTLVLKQFLYFDRYIEILAPEVDMFYEAQKDVLGLDV